MVQIKLQSGSTLNIKSLTFKGSITDSNGKPTGGNADFVFIESEVNALDNKLKTIGLSVQSLYDSVFPPIEEEQTEQTE